MKVKLIWSTGLYTLDFVVYNEENGVLKSVIDLPPIFPNGDVRDYIKLNYKYDSRMERGLFKVFMGLDVRDSKCVNEFMADVVQKFGFTQTRIQNIEELIFGSKDLHTLIKEFNELHNQ